MGFDVTMPDGTVIQNVPDGTTKEQLAAKYSAHLKSPRGKASLGEQPSTWDRVVASPIGRLAHDTVIDAADGVSQVANYLFTPSAVKKAYGGELPSLLAPVQRGYEASLARNRNTPGYAAARAAADKYEKTGLSDQVLAPLMPALSGATSLLFSGGDLDVANASADAKAGLLSQYREEHPLAGNVANFAGGFMGAPANAITATTRAAVNALPKRSYAFFRPPEVKGADYVMDKLKGSSLRDPEGLASFNTGGKPLTTAEAIGKPAEVGIGAIARRDGPTADAFAAEMFARGQAAPARIMDDFAAAGGIIPEAARGDIEALVKAGRIKARPLYEEAFAGGSIAPLKDQLGSLLQRATSEKGLIAREIAEIERDSAGALASRGAAGKETRERYMQLHEDLKQAESDRLAAMEMFQRAQGDIANNTPGAIWSPRVQMFLDDPVMKQGLRKGLEVQRLEALAEGRKFSPTEFGVTGFDEAGDPIISTVPNMRLLDSGKRGLDEILKEAKDATTGRINWTDRLRAIDNVRRSYIGELDNLNPRYKAARDQAGDYLSAVQAFDDGGKMLLNGKLTEKQFAEHIERLSPADREAFKGGIANHVFDMAQNGKLAPKAFGTPRVRSKLASVFGEEQADRLIGALSTENRMTAFARKRSPGSESPTAEYSAEFAEMDDVPAWQRELGNIAQDTERGAWATLTGPVRRGFRSGADRFMTRGLGQGGRTAAGEILRLPPQEAAARLRQLRPVEMPLSLLSPNSVGTAGLLTVLSGAAGAGR